MELFQDMDTFILLLSKTLSNEKTSPMENYALG